MKDHSTPMTGPPSQGRPVVAFVGRSGSGKTTLLLALVPELVRRGVRLGVIKHSSHLGVEIDVPGSDTRRLWDAGAQEVALVTPDRIMVSRRLETEPLLLDIIDRLGDVDLVILEGYKRSAVPKIEVIRAACTPRPIDGLEGRVACVTDVDNLDMGGPSFALDAVEDIADFLVNRFLGGTHEWLGGDGPYGGHRDPCMGR